jgi:hypothetical protein
MFSGAAAPMLFDTQSETVTYTPAGGTAVSLSAIVERTNTDEESIVDGQGVVSTAVVKFRNDVTFGITTASRKDTVTIGSDVYYVFGIKITNSVITLMCQRTDKENIGYEQDRHVGLRRNL